jgi:hypothetical protein
MSYEALFAETVLMRGHQGDRIDAYVARPFGAGPYPGVVIIHHMPGWDGPTKEIARRVPHLRGSGPRVLRGGPAELPAGGGHRRLEEGVRLLRAFPALETRSSTSTAWTIVMRCSRRSRSWARMIA